MNGVQDDPTDRRKNREIPLPIGFIAQRDRLPAEDEKVGVVRVAAFRADADLGRTLQRVIAARALRQLERLIELDVLHDCLAVQRSPRRVWEKMRGLSSSV
jgi:hypothetical protein